MVQLYHNRNVNKNSLLFKVDYTSTNENPQNTAITTTSDAVHEEQDEETAEVKKFVICPKCGEKIWL